MTFAHVGSTLSWDASSGILLTPNGVGNLIVLCEVTKLAQTPMLTNISSSNVTWSRLTPDFDTSVASTPTAAAIWIGTVTSTSQASVTLTWTGGGSEPAHWEAEVNEFSSTVGSWSLDTYAGIDANGGNHAYPSLTPAGADELYVGIHYDDSGASAGSTSGYTYHVTSHGNGALYNADCTSSTQSPTWAGTEVMGGIAALIKEAPASDSGTAAVTLKKMTVAGSGVLKDSGTTAATLKKMTVSGTATAPLVGTAAVALKKMTVSGSGSAAALYAAYAFDEGAGSTIIDHSGNGHDMTIVGSNSWVAGQGSYVKAFQSGATTSDGAYYDHGSADSSLASDVVVMMWYKHTGSTSTSICHVGGIYSASATARLSVYSYRSRSGIASSPHLTVRDSAGTISDVGVNSTTADSNWHHAAAVYHANGLIEEYLDGSLVASSTPTANPIGSNSRYIGVGDFLSGLATTEAQVQDLRVFSGALNADKIIAFMNTPVQNVTTGTGAVTLKKMTAAVSGAVFDKGTSAATLKKMTVSATDSKTFDVWNDTLPPGTSVTPTGTRTDGLTFEVTRDCYLDGIAFYVDASETDLTGSNYTADLYSTTTGTSGTNLASQAGSGTFTAGAWNWISFSPVHLSPGTFYVAAITSPNFLTYIHSYWGTGPGSGGFICGPITVPRQADAPGTVQEGFNSAGGYPASVNGDGSWYGVDVKVSIAVSGTAGVTLKKMTVAASGTVASSDDGTAAVTLKKMTVAISATVFDEGTSAATLKKMTVAVSATVFDKGTSAAVLRKMTVSASGTAPVAGTGAPKLRKMTAVGIGKAKVSGTIAVTKRKMTVSGTGLAPIFGTVAITMPKMTANASDGHVVQASSLFLFMQP